MTQPTPPVDPAGPLTWLNGVANQRPVAEAAAPTSDPGTYAGVMETPRVTPPAAGGGSFAVDMERAPAAIRELEAALTLLRDLRQDVAHLGNVVTPARDEVSADAATLLGSVAVGGQGSLDAALDAGAVRLKSLIEGLRADLRAYRASELAAASTPNGDARV